MAHDKNGIELMAGDTVLIPCKVLKVENFENNCNVTLETSEPVHPNDYTTGIVLNTKQCVATPETIAAREAEAKEKAAKIAAAKAEADAAAKLKAGKV